MIKIFPQSKEWIEFTIDEYNSIGDGLVDPKFNGICHIVYNDNKLMSYETTFTNGVIGKKGILRYKNGDIYEGEFEDELKNGKFNGHGGLIKNNGEVYCGEFKDGKMTGKINVKFRNGDSAEYEDGNKFDSQYRNYSGKGKYTYKNGNKYCGDIVNNRFTGKGKFTSKNGKVYEGMFSEGRFMETLNGVLIFSDKKYKGEFTNGKIDDNGEINQGIMHGNGILIYGDYCKCEGNFTNGILRGKCKIMYNNGDIFEGELETWSFEEKTYWRNAEDLFDGTGKMSYKNGDIYEGGFKNKKFDGVGKMMYKNGNIYEGGFKNGKFDGHGKFYNAEKIICEGAFSNGEYRGNVILHSASYKYEGEVKKLMFTSEGVICGYTFHGNGKIEYKSGNTFDGKFSEGEIDGYGIYCDTLGNICKGIFTRGTYNGNIDLEVVHQGNKYNCSVNQFTIDCHSGVIQNFRCHGYGEIKFSNGDVKKGEFENGYFKKGKIIFNNCNVYEGEFKDNIFSGKGKLSTPLGNVYEGFFDRGLPHGDGKLELSNGKTYDVECVKGTFYKKDIFQLFGFGTIIDVKL